MPLKLKNIRREDESEAAQFLGDNPRPGVRLRPEEELGPACETGQALAYIDQEGRMVGISFVYQFDTAPRGGLYSEIGSQTVTIEGLGLQAFAVWIHFLQFFLEEFEEGAWPAVFAVVGKATPSEHNLTSKCGMTPWSPAAELCAERSRRGLPFHPEKRVIAARPECFVAAHAALRALHLGGALFHAPKGNETIQLELGWFGQELLQIEL